MSRQASRRCTTPTPLSIRTETSSRSSSSSSSSSSLKRILSIKGRSGSCSRRSMTTLEISSPELLPTPSASPPTKDHVHQIISKSLDQETGDKIHSVSLSSNLCRRATTPIIFSQTTARRKPPQVEKKLLCSLEDLCFGCTKKIKVTRDVIKHPGVILEEEEILKIEIKAGWRKGTKITFEGKGDEKPGFLPGDIVFIIDEKPHPLYTRNGNNLEIGVEISLVDALTGCCIPIPLLGGENMSLSLENVVIYHGHEKVIEGQGMPNPKNKGTRGDLVIKFLIHFPTELSDEQRQEAFCILQDCC
ncbi:putative chaperone DnaJ [Lupinus albus]|uniref:Putative chaperone DnaJ n=1 Tax=Lupinus albus TaxID=3870 RepID=A0A6A4NIE7_LUPAL|nr:putative chaperone DnaJ [Lupinus albus]